MRVKLLEPPSHKGTTTVFRLGATGLRHQGEKEE